MYTLELEASGKSEAMLSFRILQSKPTSATVSSSCHRLAKDTEVPATVPPDHRVASFFEL